MEGRTEKDKVKKKEEGKRGHADLERIGLENKGRKKKQEIR